MRLTFRVHRYPLENGLARLRRFTTRFDQQTRHVRALLSLSLGLLIRAFRFKDEFRHNHLPGIAFDVFVILRIRSLTAPPDDGQHGGGPAPGPGRRLETPGEASHHRARLVQQFPASLSRDARPERIARRKSGDCAVDLVACFKASCETKVHVPRGRVEHIGIRATRGREEALPDRGESRRDGHPIRPGTRGTH